MTNEKNVGKSPETISRLEFHPLLQCGVQLTLILAYTLFGLARGSLRLELDVVVVAGVGSGHVKAVPSSPVLKYSFEMGHRGRRMSSTYQNQLAMTKPDPVFKSAKLLHQPRHTNCHPSRQTTLENTPKPSPNLQICDVPRAIPRSTTRCRRSIYPQIVSFQKSLQPFHWPGCFRARASRAIESWENVHQ